MKLPSNIGDYLTGKKFDSGLRVDFEQDAEDRIYRSRQDWIVELSRDKRVVHVGCVDHNAQMIRAKINKNKWLHKRLDEAAERCLGVDIDEAGIAYMRDELGYRDLLTSDVLEADLPAPDDTGEKWDLMVVAEVLEHIDNPVQFLSRLAERQAGRVKTLLVSVPNAFAAENRGWSRAGLEVLNSDHRYWFTPYTLSKVLDRAGLRPSRLITCRNGKVKPRAVLRNAIRRRHPLIRDTLISLSPFPDSA